MRHSLTVRIKECSAVSIHAPGRGATNIRQPTFYFIDVSIHAPGRGATNLTQGYFNPLEGFNSRTREGCDSMANNPRLRRARFQFTHPGGVRRGCVTLFERGYIRFNSRTREGCDYKERPHIPRYILVSIHAPGRGATSPELRITLQPMSFNSRTREGCDDRDGKPNWLKVFVSIHAPGRGATSCGVLHWSPRSFQFTHPGGVRQSHLSIEGRAIVFQFTHPGGVRLILGSLGLYAGYVSIHAPGRGATSTRLHRHTV